MIDLAEHVEILSPEPDRIKKNCLVIGATGFVGSHLLSYLEATTDMNLYATKLPQEISCVRPESRVLFFDLDILSEEATNSLIESIKPDVLIHLAAQSSVGLSFSKPALTADINVRGCIHVLEAVRAYVNQCTILIIGSSEQYGVVPPACQPIHEDMSLVPQSPYAITKMAAELFSRMYVDQYKMKIIMVRAFNHIGPGQSPLFVVSDFAKQIAEIEKGIRTPVLRVGNLTAKRDFTDVRDIVRGYVSLVEGGRPGEVYNIGSGRSLSVQYILDTLISLSNVEVKIEIDPEKIRPTDAPDIYADIHKIQTDTSWTAKIAIEQSLLDTLNYWRETV